MSECFLGCGSVYEGGALTYCLVCARRVWHAVGEEARESVPRLRFYVKVQLSVA